MNSDPLLNHDSHIQDRLGSAEPSAYPVTILCRLEAIEIRSSSAAILSTGHLSAICEANSNDVVVGERKLPNLHTRPVFLYIRKSTKQTPLPPYNRRANKHANDLTSTIPQQRGQMIRNPCSPVVATRPESLSQAGIKGKREGEY